VERKATVTKVLDSFLFTHEFDLLEVRLRTLWPVVDKFLLIEGDHNFTNQPKELKFWHNRKRFEWAAEKLIYGQNLGKQKEGDGDLVFENQHRQCLYETAKSIQGFSADDILLTSDVDEIPSREAVEWLKLGHFVSPTLFKQELYYYNSTCHMGKKWDGTIATTFGHDLGNIGNLRSHRNSLLSIKKNCGWHLAHFYDADGIKEKLIHSSHKHYNSPDYYDAEYLKQCVEEKKNYLGKGKGADKPEPIPQYLIDELSKFPVMMGEFK
jgi:beta-1,4-mannosyl-glycoprotein beta-1,4-N-acetylglucosaminyltransferase